MTRHEDPTHATVVAVMFTYANGSVGRTWKRMRILSTDSSLYRRLSIGGALSLCRIVKQLDMPDQAHEPAYHEHKQHSPKERLTPHDYA